MSNLSDAFAAERNHWRDLAKKYTVYCEQAGDNYCSEADTERVIKCLMNHYRETEEQIIARLEASNIENPIEMNDEIFWIEK